MRTYKLLLILTLLLAFLSPSRVFSAEFNYRFGVGLTSYENINLVQEPIGKELARSMDGSITATENSANMTANLRSSFSAIDYKNNQVEDESIGRMLANALYRIQQNRFEWYVSDIFTQISIDQLVANNISNRQNTNAFVTGPNYLIRLNPRNRIQISVRGEDYKYEISDIDNRRLNTSTNLIYQVNSSLNYSLSYEFEKVNFSNNISNSDFLRNDIFLTSEYQFSSNNLELEYGFTQIDFKNFSDIQEYRYLISLESTRTRTSTIGINFSHSLEDTASNIVGLIEISESDTGFIRTFTTSSDVFTNDEVDITFDKAFQSSELRIRTNLNNNRYSQQVLRNTDVKGLFFNYTWNFRGRSSAMIESNFTTIQYKNIFPEREDKDKRYRFRYSYNASRHMHLNYIITSEDRESSIDNNDYSDLRFTITLSYSSR